MQKPPYIDIHTHHSNRNEGVVALINYFPEQINLADLSGKIVSVGLHPWHLDNDSAAENLDLIIQLPQLIRY